MSQNALFCALQCILHCVYFTDADPRGMDVDPITGLLYLADEDKKEIQAIDFDLRTTKTIIKLSAGPPFEVAVDGQSG